MKKVMSILAVAIFTMGLVSCESEATAETDQLYIDSPDGDELPDPDCPTGNCDLG